MIEDNIKDYLLKNYEPNNGIDSLTPIIDKIYRGLVNITLKDNDIDVLTLKYDGSIKALYKDESFDLDIEDDVSKEREEIQRELLKIRELSIAVNDLNLKLDLEPNNDKLYKLFKMYAGELEMCISKYNKKYNPLEVCDDIKDNYTWYKGPWPWEGMNV